MPLLERFLVFTHLTYKLVAVTAEPPSVPRNLTVVRVDQTTVTLRWDRPEYDGGRNDVRYRVACDICGHTVHYVPSQTNFSQTQVVLSGLTPGASYRITVYAENGVSELSRMAPFADITVNMKQAGTVVGEDLFLLVGGRTCVNVMSYLCMAKLRWEMKLENRIKPGFFFSNCRNKILVSCRECVLLALPSVFSRADVFLFLFNCLIVSEPLHVMCKQFSTVS